MKTHEWIHFYFECLAEAGEQMSFDLIKYTAQGEEVLTYNHLQYDGVSALCEHLQQWPGKKVLPPLSYQPPPSGWRIFWLLNRWWYSVSYRRYYLPKGKSHSDYLFGDRKIKMSDETNLNAKILWSLHQALETQRTSLWMLPVSLHPRIEVGMKPQNNVSFIDIKVKTQDSVQTLKEKIGRELKFKAYWATIYSMLLPKLLGKSLFKKVFPYFRFFLNRTGTFTNLGKWQIEGLQEDEFWGIKATVVPLNPLAASALQVNQNLTIGLQLHPCLGLSQSDLDRILDRWQQSLHQLTS